MEKPDIYQSLRARISARLGGSSLIEYLFLPFDFFHLLFRLAGDDDVPAMEKVKLAGAIIYLVSPLDIMPEMFIGPIGFLDDIALGAYVLNGIVNKTFPEVLYRCWAGTGGVLEKTQTALRVADKMIGAGLIKKLRGRF